jgi:chorismate dehydratase
MSRVRIGAVSFLNTRPLVYGLQSSSEYKLSFDTPSNLAEKLRLGEIDVGLIPIVEHLRGVGDTIVPGMGIAADGPVRTVRLYSRVALQSIADVAVDGRSRTSVALLRVLLAEGFGITPDFYSYRADLKEMLRAHEAALLIGDDALRDADVAYPWDLAQAWKELTGLPFVFAVWVANHGVDVDQVGAWLRRALAEGLANLDEIARQAAGTGGQNEASLLSYLRDSLHFVLGERDLQGIEAFRRYCQRYNLVAGTQPVYAARAVASR